jgi:dTDP-4-dehydrorhamnose 3,5-epimerase-like enzyme
MGLAAVRWIESAHTDDDRGTLSVLEEAALPFPIKRIFYMHRIPEGLERGGHAHQNTQQHVIALSGRFVLDVSDGDRTETYVLDDPNRGLYLPAMTWVRLYGFEANTVILVLCDTKYDHNRVIRNWDHYCRLQRESR